MTDEKRHVVRRFDCTANGRVEYLRVEKSRGIFEWGEHAAHATKMSFINAVTLAAACRVGGDEFQDKSKDYLFGVSDA